MARNETYEEFVKKFEPKKTTDDCYTPPEVYDCVRDWACEEYGIDPDKIVRPFWPGGDYEHYAYPEGYVVLDNPPFSIHAKIIEFYLKSGIQFFLFTPGMTAFSRKRQVMKCCHIITDTKIIYENGAVVNTVFVTSLEGDVVARSAPDLKRKIENVKKKIKRKSKIQDTKYQYPSNIITSAMFQHLSKNGIEFSVRKNECIPVTATDAQKKTGKSIFGGGLLLSNKKAEEKAMAERQAAERQEVIVWELSEREREIIESMEG